MPKKKKFEPVFYDFPQPSKVKTVSIELDERYEEETVWRIIAVGNASFAEAMHFADFENTERSARYRPSIARGGALDGGMVEIHLQQPKPVNAMRDYFARARGLMDEVAADTALKFFEEKIGSWGISPKPDGTKARAGAAKRASSKPAPGLKK